MERESFKYKLRRKLQAAAGRILPKEFLSKVYFKIVLGKDLSFKDPKTFNEKLQWYKLYYCPQNPLVVQGADKYAAREYVKSKGLEDKLVPLEGVWDKPSDIDWDVLPEKFVLKCNHGCAYNIVCSDKASLDIKSTKKKLAGWLKEDFGLFNLELHYSKIKNKKITAEKFLGSCITDYKFFCFNGKPEFVYVSTDLIHDRQAQIGFFYLDGKKMPLKRDDYTDIEKVEFPAYFEDMLNDAKTLCGDFPFVRVDFFITEDSYYFAELTFTPSACMMPFNPDKYDLEWGKMLNFDGLIKNEK